MFFGKMNQVRVYDRIYVNRGKYEKIYNKLLSGKNIRKLLLKYIEISKKIHSYRDLDIILNKCCLLIYPEDMKLLIDNGASPCAFVAGHNCYFKLIEEIVYLHMGISPVLMIAKLEFLFDIDKHPSPLNVGFKGNYCIDCPVSLNRHELVEKLIDLGADINVNSGTDHNLLLKTKNVKTIKLLINSGINLNNYNHIRYLFDKRIENEDLEEIINLMIDKGLNVKLFPLQLFMRHIQENFIFFLLTVGFNIDSFPAGNVYHKFIHYKYNCFPKVLTLQNLCLRIVKREQIDVKFQKQVPLLFKWNEEIPIVSTDMKQLTN